MCGKYKPSPVTILHWANAIAKADFEAYIFHRYNKWRPATIWDRVDTTVYHHSGQPHRITFAPQISDMERDISLLIQVALQI